MTTGTINQEPLYSCCGCAEHVSLPADELRIYYENLWCETCWDYDEYCAEIEYDDLQGFDDFLKERAKEYDK